MAPPPSHHDPLRVTPVDQLVALSDPELVDKALQLFTTDNFSGSISLPDGSAVSMRDCILEFVDNSKIREGREIKKQLNERLDLIKALVDVERFKNKQTDDGSEVFFDDDFSSIGLFDDADEIQSAVKRKRLATLDTVTVGAGHDPSSVCLFVNRSTSKRALISPSLSVNCFLISRPSLILELPTNSRMQSFIDTAEPSGKLMEPLKLSVVNNCYARLTNAGSVNVAS